MKEVYLDDYIKTTDGRIAIINDKNPLNPLVGFFDDGSEKRISLEEIKEVLDGNSSLNIGDKVKLENVFYQENTDENPFDCHGVVIDYDGYWYYVEWNNGFSNTYRKLDADLILIN